eukprot:UN01951
MATNETKSQLLQDSVAQAETSNMAGNAPFITDTVEETNIMMTIIDDQYKAIEIEANETDPQNETFEVEPEPLCLSRTRSLSDILNRSTPVLFLKTHGAKLIGKQDFVKYDDRIRSEWTNWMVGLSCACFLMPSITIIILQAWNTVRMCIIFDAIYFLLVAICSFLSDYVYCYVKERPCNIKFEIVDNWTATGGVLIVIINILINPYPVIFRLFDFGILLFAIYLINKSRNSQTGVQWRKCHC